MRSKSILLLTLALGCGLVASIGISQVMEARNHGSGDQGDLQPIFVAMTDINANDVLSAQVIKLEEWPKSRIPQGALTKLEEVEGKRCRMKLYQGEPILSAKLLGPDESIGAAKEIPPGYRVAHVKVDAVTGASNLILPGDRVDVLVFRNTTSNDLNATAVKIVLQDVKVFAVDTHTETEYTRTKSEQSEPISAKTISLLVTPQQAVILHGASEISGSVRLVLRNPDDDTHISAPSATLADIFGPDQRSDRKAEHGERAPKDTNEDANKDTAKSELVGWLNEKNKEQAKKAPAASDSLERPAYFKMVVISGSDVREMEFAPDGKPAVQPKDEKANSVDVPDSQDAESQLPDSQLTGQADDEASPPTTDAKQDEM